MGGDLPALPMRTYAMLIHIGSILVAWPELTYNFKSYCTAIVMLGEILEHGAELRWLCGSVFGLVGAIATNISQRRNMVNIDRHAST